MNKKLYILVYVLLGIGIGFVLGRMNFSDVQNVLPLSCTYKNQTYKDGEGFMDDCNSCSCQNGEIQCTAMACSQEAY